LNTPSPKAPPSPEELDALLRLLDDETPEVRSRVAERLTLSGGDLSEWLATRPHALTRHELDVLAELLIPPRRETLLREWVVPSGGAAALGEDWESFESLLRMISDFIHDGITIRQPLSDALDLLAEEAAEAGVSTSRELRSFLFNGERLVGNNRPSENVKNSDLAWSIAECRSNPLGLGIIFILVGRRMDLAVEGVNFPGHFLCRIHEDGYPILIDCFDNGRLHLQSTFLESPELSRATRSIVRQPADPGSMLTRLLNNLLVALDADERLEDAALIRSLRATLG
jgi:hypothetical protein